MDNGLVEIIVIVAIVIAVAAISFFILLMSNKKYAPLTHKNGEKDIAYYWRVFKWFLIGNYKCENANDYIWCYILLNKIFWSSNVVLCSIGIGTIIQWMR